MTMPSTSPMAQPVRQWTVAEKAVRFRDMRSAYTPYGYLHHRVPRLMETVDLQVADGAATITLNRPDVLNAWNAQFGKDLLEAVEACAGDDAVRAVLIRGAGRGFSSGADLRDVGGDVTPEGHPDVR